MFSGYPSKFSLGVTLNMNRLISVQIFLLISLGTVTLYADNTVSATSVYTDPAGAMFYVDGQTYTGAATFLWPQGSKHTLSIIPTQQASSYKAQYAFTGWTDSTGILTGANPTVIITADPGINWYKASLTLQYAVSLNFYTCPSGVSVCSSPGTVFVDTTPYTVNTDVYVNAGSTVTLQAVPNTGYVFTGWLPGIGNSSQAFLNSFTLNAPVQVFPQFLPAGAVTLASNQPGLQVLADHTLVFSPVTLDWGVGTTHTLGAPPWQSDLQGRLWVFSSWSDGGSMTHAYTMPSVSSLTLTAAFVPGGRVTFFTNPTGLNLIVDGLAVGPPYNLVWGAGVPHTISAPAQQVDLYGNGWAFQSWSNGGPATQTVTLTPAQVAAGFRLTANYAPSTQTTGQIVIQSSPSGVDVLADGADCYTPCTLQRTIGAQVALSAPALVQIAADTRLAFLAWADGAPATRTVTVATGTTTLTANYQSYYLLSATADPAGEAKWQFSPESQDGFYSSGTPVIATVTAATSYSFDHWQGDASGTSPNVTVAMTQPRTICAVLKRTGNDGIDSITNAAGPDPEDAISPGSIISIYGPKLAPGTATGPASPLTQTLEGVTVTIGDQLLPLLVVSPGQINAQLPSGLGLGEQTLTVHNPGQPDAIGVFTAQRNAPGLFSQQISGRPYWVAMHADGSLVTTKSPARRGETVTALGTGFGPFHPQPPDGFAVPASATFPLVDPVELEFSGNVVKPEFTGAAPGRVGITEVRFKIADPFPTGATVEIKMRVNGHESNTVLLALE
jgi:uncharacterized protein (TIGR03437 family)